MKLLKSLEQDASCHALIHYLPTRGERDYLREAMGETLKDKPQLLAPPSDATREKPVVLAQRGLPAFFRIETPAPYFDFATKSGGDDFCTAFRSCLSAANDKCLNSVVIGPLSLGIGGYPLDLAIALLLQTEREWHRAHRKPHLKSVTLASNNSALNAEIRQLIRVYSDPDIFALPKVFEIEALWKVERVLIR